MKNFLKNYLTLEQPYGEIWLFIVGVITLFALGLLHGKESLELINVAISLLFIFSVIALFTTLWRRRNNTKNNFFRANGGAVIIKEGLVLAFERRDKPGVWQLPQGGIDAGEDPYKATLREVEEETAITIEDLEHIATYPEWIAYELPKRTEKHGLGQIQKWHFFKFVGDEAIIVPQAPEFTDKRWIEFTELIKTTSPFKVAVYEKLLFWATENDLLK